MAGSKREDSSGPPARSKEPQKPKKQAEAKSPPLKTRLKSLALLSVIKLPSLLPYKWRPATVGWLMSRVVAPLAGYDDRIRANLAHARPDLPEQEVKRLTRAVPENIGRMVAEISSGARFRQELETVRAIGPGVSQIEAARDSGRAVIFVSGHFGNFEAARYAMVQLGLQVAALYRPIDDPLLDREFHSTLEEISAPVFPRGRRGLAAMIRFIRGGNAVAILLDQYVNDGAPLTFFDQTAPTSLSAAELALKYDALLVPGYGIRKSDGFEVIVEEPIPHTDPVTMTQAINDSLEAQVRNHMDQWLWIHRRWKPERQRKRAAAKTGP